MMTPAYSLQLDGLAGTDGTVGDEDAPQAVHRGLEVGLQVAVLTDGVQQVTLLAAARAVREAAPRPTTPVTWKPSISR